MARTTTLVALIVAVSSVALMVATSQVVMGDRSQASSISPLKVAETLNCLIQSRFEKIDMRRFGLSRIISTPSGHPSVALIAETPEEKKWLRIANAAQRDYTISFLHMVKLTIDPERFTRDNLRLVTYRSALGDKPYLITVGYHVAETERPERSFSKEEARAKYRRSQDRLHAMTGLREQLNKLAVDVLPRLKKGEKMNTTLDGWLVAMRPVKASKAECLGCHTGVKMGDTLGAMVYAVSKRSKGGPV